MFTEIFSIKLRHDQFTIKAPNSSLTFHKLCNNIERVSEIPGYLSDLILIREFSISNGKISDNPSLFKLCVYRIQITEQPQ